MMSTKSTPRNAPCPCGSGKKYKKCCMEKDRTGESKLLYNRLRKTVDHLSKELMEYASNLLGEGAIFDAWYEFTGGDDKIEFEQDSPHNPAFLPWYIYNWEPDWEDFEINEYGDMEDNYEFVTIADCYLKRFSDQLTEMEQQLIKLNIDNCFSFHEVVNCQPGEGFTLKDILLDREVYVFEYSASQTVRKGDILYGKVIKYDNVGVMLGCAGIKLPPVDKIRIIDLRSLIQSYSDSGGITDFDLYEWESKIRALYFDIYLHFITPPQFKNRDGDPIEFQELLFEIASPQIAFDKLKFLALDRKDEDLLDDAELDEDGLIIKAEIPWLVKDKPKHPMGETIIKGQIEINKNELRVSVNSKNRAKKIRKEIEKRLKEQVIYLKTEKKSFESSGGMEQEMQKEELTPELKEEVNNMLEEMMEKHWKNWLDENIPALVGLTPRQAAENKDGREKLIALLNDFEQRDKYNELGVDQTKYIRNIRKQLGLEKY